MNPKLLITTGIFPPEIGGPGTYVYTFSGWLSVSKINLVVIVSLVNGIDEILPYTVIIQKKKGDFPVAHKDFF